MGFKKCLEFIPVLVHAINNPVLACSVVFQVLMQATNNPVPACCSKDVA